MTKEKIGIITVHKNTNYGANLQAYASCKYINQLGYDCEIIDYVPPIQNTSNHLLRWIYTSWKNETSRNIVRRIKLLIALVISIPSKAHRLYGFERFRKEYCKISSSCSNVHDIIKQNYETVVCGSDQIWNPAITGGVNSIYYGDIDGVEKRIAYAASIGKERLCETDEQSVKQLVKKIDYCSLREESSVAYIRKLSGKDVSCVCDPVFLLTKYDYECIASKRIISRPYVLLYSVIPNSKMLSIAQKYADENNLKLVEICAGKNRHHSHTQFASLGPQEFLSCIRYAEVVFTNSFHGTAFSIILEKEFYAVDNKNGGSRIVNLLSKAGLDRRLISEYNDIDDNVSIEYGNVQNKMQSYVEASKEFLANALATRKNKVVDKGCVGCAACQTICNVDAIKMLPNKEGFLEAFIDEKKCVSCGRCQSVCPAMNEPLTNINQDMYAFKATDDLRKQSASGGAFAAMSKVVIDEGGSVWGAAQNSQFIVEHQKCENFDNIYELQGTKYVQSSLEKCYCELEKDLRSGRKVLFSGTPCQVEAIKRFVQMKKLSEENLYLVDIICHGVPSPKVYSEFINWLSEKKESEVVKYSFRNKEISWRGNSCLVELKNGKKLCNDLYASSFMNLYYSNYITRESCYSCKYATIARTSDITIGDYWGIENLASNFEDALGVSVVLVNTEQGRQLFKKTKGKIHIGDITTLKQPQLTHGCERPVDRTVFWTRYQEKGIGEMLRLYGGIRRNFLKEFLYSMKLKLIQRKTNQ